MTAFLIANIKLVLLFALVSTLAGLSSLGRREAMRATTTRKSRQPLSV